MRFEGKAMKRWWFSARARQLIAEEFKFSDQWFYGFCRRHCISLWRKTHTAQNSPAELKNAIEVFHGKSLRERWRETFSLFDIANMDKTPLPFVMGDGKTYNQTGSKEIWCASGSSELEKRQCTVQLTIFADGVSRVRLLLIFRGKGLCIKAEEKRKWDKQVKVLFQKNAWCNEKMMKEWTADKWANYFTNPPTPGPSGKILVADVHRAQQTANVKQLLQNKSTLLINVLPACTSRVEPLNVSINKPFKHVIREQFEKHLSENLHLYTVNKLPVSERRVLTTKSVTEA